VISSNVSIAANSLSSLFEDLSYTFYYYHWVDTSAGDAVIVIQTESGDKK
jgi:hypothetical protein